MTRQRTRRPGLTPAERSLRTRIGAYRMHVLHDPKETTRGARDAFWRRFVHEVDPHRILSERERVRRAEAARRAYFAQLAYQSARRRKRRHRRVR